MSNLAKRKGEKIILSVGAMDWKPMVANAIANRQVIMNRDVGDIVALPAEDYLKTKAIRAQPLILRLTITFFSQAQPPFNRVQGINFVRAIYNIPDVRREVLDWTTIKNACGGSNGFLWGRFRATASLDNGRKMAVYGSSETNAKNLLETLAKLSTAKITSVTVSEELRQGLRAENKKLYKETTRLYPGYFSVLNEKKILNEALLEGSYTGTLIGNFKRQSTPKIPLWVQKEPSNTKALIVEALKDRSQKVKE